MKTKMKYGIDLGTTNSAICKMERGEVKVMKNLMGDKETLPSCVQFTKKKIDVGDKAYRALSDDPDNVFIEFKRTMGETKLYANKLTEGPFAGKAYNSEDLSSEVLKALKTFVTDEKVSAAVITVPAMFEPHQKEATRRAAKMAGIEECALLQEPIAASMAYGMDAETKDGYWLVFDFGGGTFDAALMSISEGVMKVVSTDGNNRLGGKNLDNAIVDEILIPQLRRDYNLPEIEPRLRAKLKCLAEEAKNTLSSKDTYEVETDPVGMFGDDADGKEIDFEMTVTQEMLEHTIAPLFQKAIDITKELLQRNHLTGADLGSLILVGGPTKSPILRRMLREQVTPNVDTSIDPMTAVAKGAALYASTLDVEDTPHEEASSDETKLLVALDVQYDSTSVNEVEYVIVKLLKKDCRGDVPEGMQVQLTRGKDWVSGRFPLTETGDAFECNLLKGKANYFTIEVFDAKGDRLDCTPDSLTIFSGLKAGSATLPYNVGIEVHEELSEKNVFQPLKGMEKEQPLPATGVCNGLRVPNTLNPGNEEDRLIIPIYIGAFGTAGISAAHNSHVMDVVITGDELPATVPAGSEIDITLEADISEEYKMKVDFVALGETVEKKVNIDRVESVTFPEWQKRYDEASRNMRRLLAGGKIPADSLTKAAAIMDDLAKRKDNEQQRNEEVGSMMDDLRKALIEMERVEHEHEWEIVEDELRRQFADLEKANNDFGNHYDAEVADMRRTVDDAIRRQNVKTAREVKRDCHRLWVEAAMPGLLAAYADHYNRNFGHMAWRDKTQARTLIDRAQQMMGQNADVDDVRQVVVQLIHLLPNDDIAQSGLPIIG